MDHGWLWHLLHDPMRDNPWSLLALALIVTALLAGMVGRLWLLDWWRRRRPDRRRIEDAYWGWQQPGPADERPERPTAAPETPPPSGGREVDHVSVYDEILRASDAIKEARRVVICHPDDAEQIRTAAAEHDLYQLMSVVESPLLAKGMAYAICHPDLVDAVLDDPYVRGAYTRGSGTVSAERQPHPDQAR